MFDSEEDLSSTSDSSSSNSSSQNGVKQPLSPREFWKEKAGKWDQKVSASIQQSSKKREVAQCAKKVVSDSPGLVDFAIGLVNSVLNLPDWQVKYFEEFNWQKNCEINSAHQKILGATWNDVWARMASCKNDFLCTLRHIPQLEVTDKILLQVAHPPIKYSITFFQLENQPHLLKSRKLCK